MVVDHLGVEAFCVCGKALHQFGSLDAGRVRWPVIDLGGRHQLPTLRKPGDEYGIKIGAGGINCCGIPGWA